MITAGASIGKLTVVERVSPPNGKKANRGPYWRCTCACGNTQYVATSGDLGTGRIVSCGCYRRSDEKAQKHIVHGHARGANHGGKSRTYRVWVEMYKRCYNPLCEAYQWYGAKGVGVERVWWTFESFLRDMGECPEGLEIDRIDNGKNYGPGNCRWVTHKENCNNRG